MQRRKVNVHVVVSLSSIVCCEWEWEIFIKIVNTAMTQICTKHRYMHIFVRFTAILPQYVGLSKLYTWLNVLIRVHSEQEYHFVKKIWGAIKKFYNSVWCTNGTDKTITLFFNVISLYINTLLTFVKKFFNSSQIEFLGHVVEITTPWPAWAHRHRKTLFREGAA